MSPAELKDLLVLARSPYFCNNRSHYNLLKSIAALSPDFASEALMKLTQNFKGEPLDRALSAVNGLIEEFFALEGLRRTPVEKYFHVLERLSDSTADDLFISYVAKTERAIAETPQSLHLLYQDYRVKDAIFSHNSTHLHELHPPGRAKARNAYLEFTKTMDLMFECEQHSLERLLSGEKEAGGIKEQKQEPANLLANFLKRINRIYRNLGSDAHLFSETISLFKRHHQKIDRRFRESILILIINCCNMKLQQGQAEYKIVMDDLYRWADAQKILSDRWDHSEQDFINKALSIGMIGKYEEMTAFVDGNVEKLHPAVRDDAVHLTKAFLAFFQNNTSVALEHINKIKNQKPIYGLRVQSLLIRLHYDQALKHRNFEDMKRILESYKKYFDRKEFLNDDRKDKYMGLYYFVSQMAIRRRNELKKGIKLSVSDLRAELNDPKKTKPIGYEWLEERLTNWRK